MEALSAEGARPHVSFVSGFSSRLWNLVEAIRWGSVLQWYRPTVLQLSDKSVLQLQKDMGLSPDAGQFVFALSAQNSSGVVYVLSSQFLSENSLAHAKELIAAVKPAVVVAQVDKKFLGSNFMSLAARLEKSKMSTPPSQSCTQPVDGRQESHSSLANVSGISRQASMEEPSVPTRALDVLAKSAAGGPALAEYKQLVCLELVHAIFGATMMGHVTAAEEAAREVNSQILYLETLSFDNMEDNDGQECSDVVSSLAEWSRPHFLTRNAQKLLQPPSQSTVDVSLLENRSQKEESCSEDNKCTMTSGSSGKFENVTELSPEPEPVEPFIGELVEPYLKTYVELLPQSNALKEAHHIARRLTRHLTEGQGASEGELKHMWHFRHAVELLRIVNVLKARSLPEVNGPTTSISNAHRQGHKSSSMGIEQFSNLQPEEQQHVLVAQALRHAAEEQSCVAIVDGSTVRGLLRYWQTDVSADVAELAVKCLVKNEAIENSGSSTRSIEKSGRYRKESLVSGLLDHRQGSNDNKSVPLHSNEGSSFVISFAAATASALAMWGSSIGIYSTAVKLLGFKIPSVLKAALLLAERGMSVGGLKALPAAHWASPVKFFSTVPHGAFSGKVAVSAKAAAVSKSSSASGTMAQAIVDSAYRSSFQIGRTAFYGLMKSGKGQSRVQPGRMRVWMVLGATLTCCGAVTMYREEVERATAIAPHAKSVALMGRGLQGLREASDKAKSDTAFWRDHYRELYARIWR